MGLLNKSEKIFKVCSYLLVIVFALVTLYPIVYAFSVSISGKLAYESGLITLLPKDITLQAYEMVIESKGFWIAYANTLFYTVIGTAWSMGISLTGAYALQKKKLKFRRQWNFLLVFTMWFSAGIHIQTVAKLLIAVAAIAHLIFTYVHTSALLLLEKQGLIKLADDSNLSSTPKDIVENPKNLTFTEVEAATVPTIVTEVDIAVINSNYAMGAGFNPVEDALALEDSDSPYVNVLVCKEGNENNEAIQALAEALHSDTIKNYITETYNGAVIPVD